MKVDTIYCGDCLEVLAAWPEGCVDLAFADPPYNIGYVYDAYDDDLPPDEYVAWCQAWMAACQRVLSPTGSFYIAIGDDYAAQLRMVAIKLGLHLRNWIIWAYTFGQNARTKFSRAHTHILYLTKHPKNFVFNDHLLRFPSSRHTEYQDLRASPKGRVPNDVWDEFPRVCGTFKERDGYHGCQLPESLLARIIMASSNRGDVVLDPFVGSGTTAAVAKRLGRRYVGIDLSPEYVKRTENRLAGVRDESDSRPEADCWPPLHVDFLKQIYRETKVIYSNLRPNQVALRVIAGALNARAGGDYYDADAVAAMLDKLYGSNQLPKLPNDTPFQARSHAKEEGKRYTRKVMRTRGRKQSIPTAESGLLMDI